MTAARIIAVAALVVYAGLFALNNSELVEVDLVFLETGEHPLSLVVLGASFLGAVASALALSWPLWRSHRERARHTRRIAELEQEIHGLRTLPLGGEEDEAPKLVAAAEAD